MMLAPLMFPVAVTTPDVVMLPPVMLAVTLTVVPVCVVAFTLAPPKTLPAVMLPVTEVLVIVNALVELSIIVGLCSVNNVVLVIAVSGPEGGVKFAVYTAVPLTTLTSDKNPLKFEEVSVSTTDAPTLVLFEELGLTNVGEPFDAILTPLINKETVEPLYATAI